MLTINSTESEVLKFIEDNNIFYHIYNGEWNQMDSDTKQSFITDIAFCKLRK